MNTELLFFFVYWWQVRVTDLKGNSLGSLKVTANSATRESDEVVIISKEMLTPVPSAEWVNFIDLWRRKLRGFVTFKKLIDTS